jgi:hypothetical protein
MSTSNSLSSVVIIAGILMVSTPNGSESNLLGCFVIGIVAIKVFDNFAVAYRMFEIFKRG